MTRKKPATPEPKRTTVAELILALASYPLDGVVTIVDPFVDLGVIVDDDYHTVYHEHEGTTHYERPDVIVQEVQRGDPGDDFVTAGEFLDWLRSQSIGLSTPAHGHNETDSPLPESARARLAEEFARRETQ